MALAQLNFSQWRTLGKKAKVKPVDDFYKNLRKLSPLARNALIKGIPNEIILQKAYLKCLSNEEGLLSGIPYVIQDLFDVHGLPTTCGAPFTDPFEGALDDSCLLVETLKEQGACLFSKTVLSEFGIDIQGRNRVHGTCPHGDGTEFVCGGGASASIRMVYDGYVPLAFGIDTYGGIRIPAAFHGLFGFRMPHNLFAREGVFPVIPSIDSVGFVTANLNDLLTTFRALYDLNDPDPEHVPLGYSFQDLAGLVSRDVKAGLMNISRCLDIEQNPEINSRFFHRFRDVTKSLHTLMSRELHSIHHYWLEEYRNQYDSNLLHRIEQGFDCSTAASEEAVTLKNQIRDDFSAFFQYFDYLIMPISPEPNPKKDVWSTEFENDLIQLIAPASLIGLPALILPFSCQNNRHSAIQVIFDPSKLYLIPRLIEQIAAHYEEEINVNPTISKP